MRDGRWEMGDEVGERHDEIHVAILLSVDHFRHRLLAPPLA